MSRQVLFPVLPFWSFFNSLLSIRHLILLPSNKNRKGSITRIVIVLLDAISLQTEPVEQQFLPNIHSLLMHKLQEVKNYKRFTIICPWFGFPTKINSFY